MTKFLTSIMLAIGLASFGGCGQKDQFQLEIIYSLFEPFRLPEEKAERAEFAKRFKERVGVSSDAVIIGYNFRPFLFRRDKDQFSDATAAFISAIVNDPNMGILSITEEWYYSTHQIEPILLRRQIVNVDEGTMMMEEWVRNVEMGRIVAPNWQN